MRAPMATAAVGMLPAPVVAVALSSAELAEARAELRDSDAEPVAVSNAELRLWILLVMLEGNDDVLEVLWVPVPEVVAVELVSVMEDSSDWMRELTLAAALEASERTVSILLEAPSTAVETSWRMEETS